MQAPLPGPSKPSFLDTTAFFIAAIFSYIVYAQLYYKWNQQNDRYQLPVLVVSALVGLVSALSFDLSLLISVFCVTPKVVLVGLLVSDILHLVFQGPWQEKNVKEHVVDAEKGSQFDNDENIKEHVADVEMAVQSDADALEASHLSKTTHSGCEQPCCWHIGPSNGTSGRT